MGAAGFVYWKSKTAADQQVRSVTLAALSPTAVPEAPRRYNSGAVEYRGTEEQWSLQETVRALAAIVAFNQDAANPKVETVEATLNRAVPDVTVYALAWGSEKKYEVKLDRAVWDPHTYQNLLRQLAAEVRNEPGEEVPLAVAESLLSPVTVDLLKVEAGLTQKLTAHPRRAQAHIETALFLGTLALEDAAGRFHDIRPLLNRLTAHLAWADYLSPELTVDRQLAEVLRLTLLNNQAEALTLIETLQNQTPSSPVLMTWLRVLRLRCTQDWKATEALALEAPLLLQLEHFRALAEAAGMNQAVHFLGKLKNPPSFIWYRIANESDLSVSHGHVFSKPAIKVELNETAAVAQALQLPVKSAAEIIAFLSNDQPDSPLQKRAEKYELQAGGPILWSGYQRRHFCHAIAVCYDFLENSWGVTDEAKKIEDFVRVSLKPLVYQPFLLRCMSSNGSALRAQAIEEGVHLMSHQPSVVGPALWHLLGTDDEGKKLSGAVPDFHPWFAPEIPQGTAFEAGKRMYQIGVGDENDLSWLEQLAQRAPYDYGLLSQVCDVIDGNEVKAETVEKRCGHLLKTHLRPNRWIANLQKDNPDAYEEAMNRVTALDADEFIRLGNFLIKSKPDRAQVYLEKAYELAEDRVWMANNSQFLVERLYEQGKKDRAEEVAGAAAEVYSRGGLETYGWLKEKEQQWDEALETYRKIDKRYNDKDAFAEAGYWMRRQQAGAGWNEAKSGAVFKRYFPDGLKRGTLADFKEPPRQGAVFSNSSTALSQNGLRAGQVVVAVDGIRVENFAQYQAVREVTNEDRMKLIVWNGQEYREIQTEAYNRRFGVEMADYKP
jgi:tetratricopeptide (TPR) repeat protein